MTCRAAKIDLEKVAVVGPRRTAIRECDATSGLMAVMGRRRAVAWGVAIVALLLAIAAGRKPNMYDLPTKLCEWDDIGLSGYMSTGSRVVAFGDFNSDKKSVPTWIRRGRTRLIW